ncbi:MAG: Ig-like domain-containing protein [Fibrobacteria bacterium]
MQYWNRQALGLDFGHSRTYPFHPFSTGVKRILLGLALAAAPLRAHVDEGSGSALQLFSYFTESPPKVNGNLTDGVHVAGAGASNTTPNEWKDAYVRTITLTDGQPATLFLTNTADSLYIGLSYPAGNNGDPNRVTLYFDQGAAGGNHDDALTGTQNETAMRSTRSAVTDMEWNGTAWAADGSGKHGSAANDYFTTLFHWEFSIPLHNGQAGDLNVTGASEIGFLLEVLKNGGGGGTFYWNATNGNPNNAATNPGWADIRLGIKHSFSTFYATYAANGDPTVDGNLTDDAWRGAYRRNVVLSNFAGDKRSAVLYAIDNPTSNNCFVGLSVDDSTNSVLDYVRVYQEAVAAQPGSARSYVLDNNVENALQANSAGLSSDEYWSGAGVSWTADGEAGDQAGRGAHQGAVFNFEFRIGYNLGARDLDLNDNALMGFTFKYHDNAKAAGQQDYFWEFAANSDAVLLDETQTPDVYGAMGWPDLQLGAPYSQVVFPQDGASIEGVVPVRVYASGAGGVTAIDSVKYFRAADTSSKTKMTRIANTGEWSGAWNVTGLSDRLDTLVFRVYNNLGIFVDRLVSLTIANQSAAIPPTVRINSPSGGATITGSVTIAFTASAGSGTLSAWEISVDGGAYVSTSATTSHLLNTATLAEGTHTVQVRVTNSNAAMAESSVMSYIVVNAPSIQWSSPSGGSRVGGRLVFDYSGVAKPPSSITSESLFVDGRFSKSIHMPSGPDTLDINGLGDGTHGFQIKATDDAGKASWSQTVNLLVGNGPWSSFSSPAGAQTLKGRVGLAWHDSVTVLTTVVSDSLLVDGKPYIGLSLTGSDSLNTTAFPNGEHTLAIQVMDSQGRKGYSQTLTVILRNGITAVIDSALADSTLSGPLIVRFSVTAVSPATVAGRQIAFDGGAFRSTGSETTDTLDTRRLSEGPHTVQIRGVDSEGKEGLSRLIQFNVHNAPTVRMTAPDVDAYVHGSVTIRFRAMAVAPDSITTTEIAVGGGTWINTSTDSTHILDTRNFKDGDALIAIRATDGSGKSDTTLVREIVVDNAPPRVSYPRISYWDWAQAREGATLRVTAQGLDLLSGMHPDSAMTLTSALVSGSGILLRDDGKNGDAVAGDNVFSTNLEVLSDMGGPIAYSLRGRDALGNDTVLVGVIILDNAPPEVHLAVRPLPMGADSLNGEVYAPRVVVGGSLSDGGSGLAAASLVVRNDSGQHVQNSPLGLATTDPTFSRIVSLVPGANSIYLIAVDKAGNADTARARLTYIIPTASKLIPQSGGTLQSPNGSAVAIPAGALDRALEVTLRPVDPAQEAKPLDPKVRLLSVPMDFGPNRTQFRQPVTVTLTYTDADMDANQDGVPDFEFSKLTIVFWDGTAWVRAGESLLDREHHSLSVQVNHFTVFDIAEDNSPLSANVTAWWSTNPVRTSIGGVFHFKLPESGTVSLNILDMAGDVVNQLIAGGSRRPAGEYSWSWNGDNVNGRFAGSGLYLYVFQFVPEGGKAKTLIRKPVGLVRK